MSPILTTCATELSDHNQRGIAWALGKAYEDAASQTDPELHPSFGTPLRPSVRGSIRWNHVQAYLQKACEAGRIVDFVPVWRPTGGKSPCNQVLELVGSNCSITAVHVGDLEQTPRDAAFRRDARGSNQLMLESIEVQMPQEEEVGRVKLLLVHGAHEFDFAEIRCYHGGAENRSAYTAVVSNLERWRDEDQGGTIAWADQEPVTPPIVELRVDAVRKADASGE